MNVHLDREERATERAIRLTVENFCPTCGQPAGKRCILPDGLPAPSSCFERQLECRTAGEVIGPGRQATYALAVWPTDIVSRATIRALLPAGDPKYRRSEEKHREAMRWGQQPETGSAGNAVTAAFTKTLSRLEKANLIKRGLEFILVVDRRGLIDRAAEGIPPHLLVHEKFLDVHRAAGIVELEMHAEHREKVRQQRESELASIRSMMQNTASRDARRRSVRHEAGQFVVPIGGTIRRHQEALRDAERSA